ncbi:MAG TPA: hypothetical protein EYP36_05390, partial [Calditrichaeota bacterium]|nr:hypothetical protein [Calditrichota bacterium]
QHEQEIKEKGKTIFFDAFPVINADEDIFEMDIIKLAGGEPANFLDVGGGANVETVRNGFKIILADPNVKAILINIFGGIVRCDRVAQGVIEAVQSIEVNVPIVVRLAGTNAEEAGVMLQNSDIDFVVADSMADAAQKVVGVLKA